jgi:RNA polymerase sigma factor (sigma-70 family)
VTEGGRLDTGRVEGFERLYATTSGRVFAYALRRVDRETALEVVAEAYLVAWRRFEAIPPEPLPWLLGVARKVLANQRRSIARRASLDAEAMTEANVARSPSGDPADEVVASDTILTALARLSATEREAIALWAWEGLDGREASEALGCSRAAFAIRLHRARKRLMKELEAGGHLQDEEAEGAKRP